MSSNYMGFRWGDKFCISGCLSHLMCNVYSNEAGTEQSALLLLPLLWQSGENSGEWPGITAHANDATAAASVNSDVKSNATSEYECQ